MVIKRAEQVVDILNKLNLSPEHVSVLSSKVSNPSADAPYHNSEHLFTVTMNCYEASCYYKFTKEAQRELILAALYHDYNHSVGEHADWVNILSAVTGAVNLIPLHEPGMSAVTLKRIVNVIQSTQYPEVSKPKNILECIIRDADILQTTEEDAAVFISGLNEENGTELTVETSRQFIENHSMFTWWGETKKQKYLSE